MIQINMEKPNHCLRCPMRNSDDGCVLIQEIDTSWDWEEQYANCPLQEVEPERKKGKWMWLTDINGFVRCSSCGTFWDYSIIDTLHFHFCPNCGSYNGGEEESE